ncbi:acyl-CoA dehydrogenase family protein [Bradyrhizobium tropiciagri]|uniref:acyl-CoA dehydrogenase family protein n=1 Tax=Bradyrhizobium tropiciagri TaxID=312253 RepID=UPI001BACAB12|nr:acyl-CoA dehydrogenase family protein [Bradyrhizobium tropiciagri]MBR0898950.1 acyl-CoA dehydrogenase family protein [Bradyrhizobium tropiciagri]
MRIARNGTLDAEIWREFADSLGILGAALPEEVGGMAGGPVEVMVIMEALGQSLVVEPYLETAVLGGGLLKRCKEGRASTLLAKIVAGEARIAFASAEPMTRYALNDVSTTARREGSGWILNGAKSVVDAAPSATHFIVTARTSGERRDRHGISLFVVDRPNPDIQAHEYRLIDDRLAADLNFSGIVLPADALIGSEGNALPLIEQVIDEATVAVCAEAVGGMRRMLGDMTRSNTRDNAPNSASRSRLSRCCSTVWSICICASRRQYPRSTSRR